MRGGGEEEREKERCPIFDIGMEGGRLKRKLMGQRRACGRAREE